MRKLILGVAVALVLPGVAAAANESTAADVARAGCAAQKQAGGTQLFKQAYGAKSTAAAMKACTAAAKPAAQAELKNAAKECKAERDANRDAFATKYGTNENKKNAFGKCVSGKAKEAAEDDGEARANAAEKCDAERDANRAAFATKYGTNENKKNAFGKCVSMTARADA